MQKDFFTARDDRVSLAFDLHRMDVIGHRQILTDGRNRYLFASAYISSGGAAGTQRMCLNRYQSGLRIKYPLQSVRVVSVSEIEPTGPQSVSIGEAKFVLCPIRACSPRPASVWIEDHHFADVDFDAAPDSPPPDTLPRSSLWPRMDEVFICLLLRAPLALMDIPARQSYVMAMVPPEERGAAASVTSVPRSLASAIGPLPAGAMLDVSSFGWPLVCAGAIKLVYDALLLVQFRSSGPPTKNPVGDLHI
jgi:hypothetical protein